MSELDCLDEKAKESVISYISRKKEIVRWASKVIGEDVDPEFMESLSFGQVLCQIVNALSPTVITLNQIKSKGLFSLEDNITRFTKAVTSVYHIKQHMVPTTEDFTSKNTIKIIEGIEEVILYGIREGLSDCNYNPNFDDDYTKKEIDDAVNVLKKYRPLKSLAAVKRDIASTQEILEKRLKEKRLIAEQEEANVSKNEEREEGKEKEKSTEFEKESKEKEDPTTYTKKKEEREQECTETKTEEKEEKEEEEEEKECSKGINKDEEEKKKEKTSEKEISKKKRKVNEKDIEHEDKTEKEENTKEEEEKESEDTQERDQVDQSETETEAKKKSKDVMMRKCIVEELLSSEEKYYRYIKLIVDKFYNPIKKKGIIPLDTIKAIFSSIDVIAASSKRLIDNIRPSVETWDETTSMEKNIVLLANISRLYISYVGNYCRVLETLEKLSKNKEWNDFCQKTEEEINKEERSPLHIAALLIMPVQRVPRYVLLVKEFIKYTPKDNSEYEGLESGFKKLTETGKYINDKRETAENAFSTWKFRHLFAGKENLATPSRYFVRHCHVIVKEKNKQPNRHLFLFNNLIIISDPYDPNKSKKLKVYVEYNIQSVTTKIATEVIKGGVIHFVILENNHDLPKENENISSPSQTEKKTEAEPQTNHNIITYVGFINKIDAENLIAEIKSLKEKINQQHESFVTGKNEEAKRRAERSKSVILPRGANSPLSEEPDSRRLTLKMHSKHRDKSQTLRASSGHSHSHLRHSTGSEKRQTLREKRSKKSALLEESATVESKEPEPLKPTKDTEDTAVLSEKKKKKEKHQNEEKKECKEVEASDAKEQLNENEEAKESTSKDKKRTKKHAKRHEKTKSTFEKDGTEETNPSEKAQPEEEEIGTLETVPKEKASGEKDNKTPEEEHGQNESSEEAKPSSETTGDPEIPERQTQKHKSAKCKKDDHDELLNDNNEGSKHTEKKISEKRKSAQESSSRKKHHIKSKKSATKNERNGTE